MKKLLFIIIIIFLGLLIVCIFFDDVLKIGVNFYLMFELFDLIEVDLLE